VRQRAGHMKPVRPVVSTRGGFATVALAATSVIADVLGSERLIRRNIALTSAVYIAEPNEYERDIGWSTRVDAREDLTMNRRQVLIVFAALAMSASASAQSPAGGQEPARLRGTIEAVDGDWLDMTARSGNKVHVALPADVRTTYVVAARLSDIKPDSYIGTAAAPQPDGSLKALEVHVFPPSMRGRGEGFRPYDLEGGGSTMTNGTVGSLVETNGRVATVKYGNEEKKILIPDDVPVVSFEPTDRSALKPGAKVIINGRRSPEGTLTAASITIGKDGLMPPM
jgi:hypothetical protein